MNKFAKNVKRKLDRSIDDLSKIVYLFSENPEKNFTRKRGLPIRKVIELIISMGAGTQTKELLEYFRYNVNTPTSSAFIQQRNKLLPEAFCFLLKEFTNAFTHHHKFKGYRLLAVDGSKVSIFRNSLDFDTHVNSNPNSNGFNLLHINALYDLCNKVYLDASIQAYRLMNETRGLIDLIKRSSVKGKVILLADRGYESYNIITHINKKNWNYLIRVKAPNSSTGILAKTGLPINDEFDQVISVFMTRRQTNEIKNQAKKYRFLSSTSVFDFLPEKSKDTYPVSFRVVCIKISDDNYQYLITNLAQTAFSKAELSELYRKRWGIETSFRELKHTIGMTHFHSKKVALIMQEIYAKMILYNFCEMITLNVIISQRSEKYTFQVNFTNAIHTCIRFLRYCNDKHPPNVEALIAKYILPIRDHRNFLRECKTQATVSFLYRLA